MYHVGIDLHGTLITDHPEEVPARVLPKLLAVMRGLSGRVRLYACTGNDLGFLERKLPGEVMGLLDGAVLETGCVVSDIRTETVLVDEAVVVRTKDIESALRERGFGWVYKFARRLATVSLFTRMGLRAADYASEVAAEVKALGHGEAFEVTYSSVAVDVIPRGFNKLSGLRQLAGDEPVVGIADSMNDFELVSGADISFLPGNASPELLRRLKETGKRVQSIGEASGLSAGQAERHSDVAIVCDEHFTDAVCQALDFLGRDLQAD